MRYIADLHIHSHYSRATSKASNLFGLAAWAAVKGIDVVGTGDFTHPAWFAHLHQWLQPAEPGLFSLKPDCGCDFSTFLPPGLQPAIASERVRFILSAEISSIYKRGGKVRKVHNLLYAPDFDAVRRINATLATLGNISSDGRPILGLDSRDLLEILLEKAPGGFLVPAHIWTPWFSLFGSKSGFDRIEDCFGDLSDHIFALETGLSSDPGMNRLISALDRFTLISNSDCHSPSKLGREANIFTTEMSFSGIREGLRHPRSAAGEQAFAATVEFYPEEGKYHCDGHRKCGVCLEPVETRKLDGLCPSCGKPLTIGVLYRVMELADRTEPRHPQGSPAVHSLIPLQEIVGELLDCGPATKRATEGYSRLITLFGSEFALLLDAPLAEINAKAGPLMAEAIDRVRTNRVIRQAGYDGEFGVIRVFDEGERASLSGQGSLFGLGKSRTRKKKAQQLPLTTKEATSRSLVNVSPKLLNSAQEQAVVSTARIIVVQAGPGTGKTHTLVSRVERVARETGGPCTVITFTNKAAAEVRERLAKENETGNSIMVATFHGYCLHHLRQTQPGLRVIGPEERLLLLEELFPSWRREEQQSLMETLTTYSRSGLVPPSEQLTLYRQNLSAQNLIDLDCLVPEVLELMRAQGEPAQRMCRATGHLFVDEFQDVNQAQYQLVAYLAGQQASVFAIGDPDQAIYGFRGSDPRWFQQFITEFQPDCHQLVCNYRSGATIIRAAEAVIGRNPHPFPVAPMEAKAAFPGNMYSVVCANPEQEAIRIADQIEVQIGGTSHRALERFDATSQALASLRDIGILYRTSRQALTISRVLSQRGIPFQLVDLEAYYTKGVCRPFYAWMLLLSGLAEPQHLLWLLGEEKKLGRVLPPEVPGLLKQCFREQQHPQAAVQFMQALAETSLDPLHQLYKVLVGAGPDHPLAKFFETLITYYQLDAEEENLQRLREEGGCQYQSLPALARHLLRFSDSVLYDNRAEAVTLSTLHAAKGLEFSLVFIAGVEEGLLPLAPRQRLSLEQVQAQLEEERRLFFVGITRAVSTLYLSWCRKRALYGGPPEDRQPSSFVAELPPDALTPPPAIQEIRKRQTKHRQLSLFS
ncbi:MAG: UvrD-helicase domain-containing protein [Desulfobulbus sp.]|nr:UvrD-helicase domain-containing protein [Desulfobulbus sp.]